MFRLKMPKESIISILVHPGTITKIIPRHFLLLKILRGVFGPNSVYVYPAGTVAVALATPILASICILPAPL